MSHFTPPSTAVLTLRSGQVERAYKTYATSDFVEPAQQFNAEFWGAKTARYMDYIANDLGEKHWDSIFGALASFAIRTEREEAVRNSVPEEPHQRVPLPLSDPPSPPRDD